MGPGLSIIKVLCRWVKKRFTNWETKLEGPNSMLKKFEIDFTLGEVFSCIFISGARTVCDLLGTFSMVVFAMF